MEDGLRLGNLPRKDIGYSYTQQMDICTKLGMDQPRPAMKKPISSWEPVSRCLTGIRLVLTLRLETTAHESLFLQHRPSMSS